MENEFELDGDRIASIDRSEDINRVIGGMEQDHLMSLIDEESESLSDSLSEIIKKALEQMGAQMAGIVARAHMEEFHSLELHWNDDGLNLVSRWMLDASIGTYVGEIVSHNRAVPYSILWKALEVSIAGQATYDHAGAQVIVKEISSLADRLRQILDANAPTAA